MPKRKSPKTNNSLSKEEATPTKPAILRVVKQKSTATDENNSAQTDSASTSVPTENQPVEAELEVNNNQSQSIEVSELNSSPVLTDDAISQTIKVDNEQSDVPQILETALVNSSSSTVFIENISGEHEQSEIETEQPQLRNKPAYKKLSTATNSSGQTFTVKEKIEVSTGNFGIQKVFIISLYSPPDGSIWAYYHPVDKNQRQLWKRGCCRIEDLKKLPMGVNSVLIEQL
ncbi:hypothetical protein [Nostoc sp. 'Peltigera membranacea cyanobiont' 232]|uniref:hypothetical protein n=1 Tax=Nostoc sp. 'Peltigera membranacea cyanobiont' 232 TaxID=2014531 RepID=UPI000B9517C2|nr:hypothetical protein [Nostoc sp. 'Peltigera membranacea cyanobiont' 232]OYE00451.1 hypothetical protein CDG79_35105 [Nostoc sp. 'Peltigera membranacea cyanobiont' 232]